MTQRVSINCHLNDYEWGISKTRLKAELQTYNRNPASVGSEAGLKEGQLNSFAALTASSQHAFYFS